MKQIKFLQISITSMFILTILSGILLLIFSPDKLTGYKMLVDTLFPLFTATIIPALIGKPLTEAVRNLTDRKDK